MNTMDGHFLWGNEIVYVQQTTESDNEGRNRVDTIGRSANEREEILLVHHMHNNVFNLANQFCMNVGVCL